MESKRSTHKIQNSSTVQNRMPVASKERRGRRADAEETELLRVEVGGVLILAVTSPKASTPAPEETRKIQELKLEAPCS